MRMGLPQRLRQMHTWQGWTAWGAIITAIGALIALVAWLYPKSPSAAPTSSSSPVQAPETTTGTSAPLSGSAPTGQSSGAPTKDAVLKRGSGMFNDGDRLDLETGEQGSSLASYDVLYRQTDNWQYVSSTNGPAWRATEGVSPTACANIIEHPPPLSPDGAVLAPGSWFCLTTGRGHIAAIQVTEVEKKGQPAQMNYLVWNT